MAKQNESLIKKIIKIRRECYNLNWLYNQYKNMLIKIEGVYKMDNEKIEWLAATLRNGYFDLENLQDAADTMLQLMKERNYWKSRAKLIESYMPMPEPSRISKENDNE